MDNPSIIASRAAKYASPSPGVTTGIMLALMWIHLCFICGAATDMEVPTICNKVVMAKTKQELISFMLQYLLMLMESCCRDFHKHVQILHMGGGYLQLIGGGSIC